MPLSPGTQLGPYEIVAPLGAGGMGEVFRARDTRLNRSVAIKILPPGLAADPESHQRFQIEARAVSSLNHPNICTLFDVGEAMVAHADSPGSAPDRVSFLVMELLSGESLADRLVRGPLPFDQALRAGIELASALDAAHAHGITHRDLKPGNVVLTRSGAKLLDFGLAKVHRPIATVGLTTRSIDPALTARGSILGTFHYMAPEQIEGRDIDARADIFGFGSLLYEMATGRKAFDGDTPASVMAAILEREPPPLAIDAPAAFEHVVRRCLRKDPDERWQSARDVVFELKWIADERPDSQGGASTAHAGRYLARERWGWGVAAVATIAALVLAIAPFPRGPQDGDLARLSTLLSAGAVRSEILPPPNTTIGAMALARDGRRLAFVGREGGRTQLWVRPLDAVTAQPLAGTDGADYPFWSPDGRSLGFFADGKLKKIDAAGGPAQTLADAPNQRGGSWSEDGDIVFSSSLGRPLYRVAATGGPIRPVTAIDTSRSETSHRWPFFLADGRHFLYLALSSTLENRGIFVGSLDGHTKTMVVRSDASAAYAAPGYLFFLRDRALVAQRLNAATLALEGDVSRVAEPVGVDGFERAHFEVSPAGVLLYRRGGFLGGNELVWFDRKGTRLDTVGAANFRGVRLSPRADRAAIVLEDPRAGTPDIWIQDLSQTDPTKFTSDPATDNNPVWSPDGSQIVFSSNRGGRYGLFLRALAGSGRDEPLVRFDSDAHAHDWSRDGRLVAFSLADPAGKTGTDIWLLPMQEGRTPRPLVMTDHNEDLPRFSPNGRWVAYQSNESGRQEVSVTSVTSQGRWEVSVGGGIQPIWSANGRELFYLSPDNDIMASDVRETGGSIEFGAPRRLFRVPIFAAPRWRYDVAGDGQRFLVLVAKEEAPAPLTLVMNWLAELKK